MTVPETEEPLDRTRGESPAASGAGSQAPRSTPAPPEHSRRSRSRTIATGLVAVLVVAYGTVLAMPVVGHSLTNPWPMYTALGIVGGVSALALRPWRSATFALLALFWASWMLTMPLGYEWWPALKASANARASVLASALVMLVMVGVGARRPAAFRWMWLTIVVTTLPIAFREVLFDEHVHEWTGASHVPFTVFVNPNNYATILVLMIGIALGWMSERIPPVARWALGVLMVVCLWLVWATTSRAALVGVAAVVAMGALLAASRAGWLRGITSARLARLGPGTRVRTAFCAATVALIVAMFTVPALAALNPVARVIFPGDEETVRSDNLRVELVSFALRHWRGHPWVGTGSGSFDRLWAHQDRFNPRPGLPPHNGFVEILTENGLVVAVPLVVAIAVLLWHAARPVSGPAARALLALSPRGTGLGVRGAPGGTDGPAVEPAPGSLFATGSTVVSSARPGGVDTLGTRYLLAVHLVAFALAGTVISTPLPWMPWWLMLSGAAACAVRLELPAGYRTRRRRRRSGAPQRRWRGRWRGSRVRESRERRLGR